MILPPRADAEWSGTPLGDFPSILSSESQTSSALPLYVVEAAVATAPWVSIPQPCPVNTANRDSWTAQEREKAQDRVVATSLDHLQELVSDSSLTICSF